MRVTYDPSQITLGEMLRVYFSVAHDPTELNCQGPDEGTQYRSTIFPQDAEQAKSRRPISPNSTRRGLRGRVTTKIESAANSSRPKGTIRIT